MDLKSANIYSEGNIGNVNSHNINVHAGGDVYLRDHKTDIAALANWVSDLDFSQYQSQASERFTDGTLRWVLEAPEFVDWLNNGDMLWCYGKPGAGKTVFASFVVNYLESLRQMNPKSVAAVCYIYCRYDSIRTTHQLFMAILKQLILRCPGANIRRAQATMEQHHSLSLNDVLAILQVNFDANPNIFIVIDALDECFSEETRYHLLQILREFKSVKILITSRHLPDIERAMAGVRRLIIAAQKQDIKTHFQVRALRSPTLKNLIPKVTGIDVEGKIAEKAGGMFLLADLHTTNLAAQTNTTQLLRALESLPEEATTTYEQTLKRIRQQNPNKQRLAFHTFSWVLYALRPLTMIELRHALAIGSLNRMADEEDLDDEELIVSSCAGLIVVNRTSQKVAFLHHTVQEFLQKAGMTAEFLSEIAVTTTSLKVISFPDAKLKKYPLIDYTASAWGPLVQRHEHHQAVLDLAMSHLGEPNIVQLLSSTRIDSELRPYTGDYEGKCDATVIHLVAVYGLVRTGNAFMSIHKDTTESLINIKDNQGCTALIWAARHGHSEIIKELITCSNINVDLKDYTSHTALSWAAWNGHLQAVKELLTHPDVDVNASGYSDHTPLSYAAQWGHPEVVVELLKHPNIKVNCDTEYWRPLFLATSNGHLNVVRKLLDHPGLNPDTIHVALLTATGYGHSDIVKELLSRCADDINLREGGRSRTLLMRAAENGYLEVVRVLLCHPEVDVNSKDNFNRTPLCRAAQNGHLEVFRELLAHPKVDVNSKDAASHTPLSCAAQNGNTAIVKEILTRRDVNVNSKGNEYDQTPLSWAAWIGHVDVVKELLCHPNIDVNLKDDQCGRTPLFLAVFNSHLAVVKELLTHSSIDVNSKDKIRGQTPLSCAAEQGHLATVKELLAQPNIDIDTKDSSGRTPLSLATKAGHVEVVKALLNHPDVDVNSKEQKFGLTPLFWAALTGCTEVVKLLVDHPIVDINSRDEIWGLTPLVWAANRGHLSVVHVLIATGKIELPGNRKLSSPVLGQTAQDSDDARSVSLSPTNIAVRPGQISLSSTEEGDLPDEVPFRVHHELPYRPASFLVTPMQLRSLYVLFGFRL